MSLARYHAKRDFNKTPEPAGRSGRAGKALRFVIQKHAARRLHYDFRLELDGTLKSWAVPKGPSLDPGDKRLAVHVEDHPLEYGGFEGVIPEKQYGAGEVIVWDRGTWAPLEGDARRAYREGHLKFHLDGEKMHGAWALVRMHGKGKDEGHDNWLLIKERDDEAKPGHGEDLVSKQPQSVLSGRKVEQLKGQGNENVWDSKESDPKKAFKPAKKAAKAAGKTASKAAAKTTKTAAAKASKTAAKRKAPSAEESEPAITGRKAALPASLAPQLATLVESAPQDEGWIYEIKLDGYRLTARINRGKVTMITRNGHDWSAKFADIVSAIEGLGLTTGWLDGEVCVMNDKGVSSFGLLQQWLSNEGEGAKRDAVYMVFDMPYCEGRDLREVPLQQRKELLAAVLARADAQGPVRLSEHLDADGSNAQAQACKLGLEGLIGKRLDGTYVNGRSRDWIKLKCRQRQEFVVVGYTPPQGSRSGFGSLLLGVHEKGKLRYAGRVGTGFDQNALSDMLQRMKALAADASPFDTALPAAARVRGTQWIKPRLVAEVTFAEWTSDGVVRQGAFEGLRADKPAKNIGAELPAKIPSAKPGKATAKTAAKKAAATAASVKKIKNDTAAPVRSRAAAKSAATRSATMKSSSPAGRSDSVRATTPKATSKVAAKAPAKAPAKRAPAATAAVAKSGSNVVAGVTISHPDRVVFPADGVTKLDVARFYERVAERLLPYILDRPMSLVRCPGGIDGACFFQKHAKEEMDGVEAPMIDDSHGKNPYIVVRNARGLVGLAQMGNLELHAWNATMRNIEKPDMLVIDFDPADDVPWSEVADAARAARTLFDALGLQSFVKTTGGHGLHVVVPFTPDNGWDEIKDFCHHIALRLVEAFPDRFLATATKAKRKGKIFVDYLRNGRGATAVAPYTLRARPGATVALPLSWDDLKRDWRAKPVTLKDVMAARGKANDPWKDYFKVKQAITAKMKKTVG
ncbi:MAG TPA: non-homologous end-joining DNA ligase [Burkholderiales bacterium]|nr:non-homologous end-joining DNA ligase [Burkholderiales bacterium]